MDFIYKHLSEHYNSEDATHTRTTEKSETCNLCLRKINETCETNFYFKRVDSYNSKINVCAPCNLLFVGNKELLGHRMRGKKVIGVEKSKLTQCEKIASAEKVTLKEKENEISKISEVLDYEKYQLSLDAQPIFISHNKCLYVKREYFEKALKLIENETPSQVLKWLKLNNATVTATQFKKIIKENAFSALTLNKGKENPNILGMNKGLGLVATENAIELYAPKKHYQKFCSVEINCFKLNPFNGSRMIVDIIERFGPTRPILVINSIGVVKENLIKNTKVSEAEDKLHVCSDSGQETVCLKYYQAIVDNLKHLKKPDNTQTINLLKAYFYGGLSPTDISSKLSEHKTISNIMKATPLDPHEALYTLQIASDKLRSL